LIFKIAFSFSFIDFSILRLSSSCFLNASTLSSSSWISFFSASRSAALSSPVTLFGAFVPFYVVLGVAVTGYISGKPAGALEPSLGVVIFYEDVWLTV
jgi:hypothetical protein